ncbi:hypothetical protein SAMN05444008_107216 [Cnuella takakiae]|uniref:O-Antigen ligase n=1 Tax=Cnuella takakiae TaxID=1302690 RepID=A0A1M5BAE0_9BACT|nr:O-antigen ligase family protein [Cnuella takakiae]OLY93399.1 hypothetical protein BUE76_17045 [Cnuella takakiae]SHF39297.1 hypothetical protein SAMN05444008_107216 [Cnuella takakiae]
MELLVAIFPFFFASAFVAGLRQLLRGNAAGLMAFIVFALPLYFTSLSVSYMLGLGTYIPVLQATKELMVVVALAVIVWQLNRRFKPTTTDWILILYVAYAALYLFVPSGFSFKERLLAFKGLAFFPVVYFAGRLVDPGQINLRKWLSYICVVTIVAGALVAYEALSGEHLQQHTGYADYNLNFFNMEPAGNFGLTWTFETGSGHKRFASFYSMPLEHAAATLISASAIFALSYKRLGRFRLSPLLIVTALATLLSIAFALSRASFVGYFIMLYVYAFAAGKRSWLMGINAMIGVGVLAWMVWIKGDILGWVLETIQFADTSSMSHLLEWIDGIQAMIANPFGLGLGTSGRVSGAFGENIGGENQLIIIGVQLGFVGVALYAAAYVTVIWNGILAFRNSNGKEARLGLMLFLSRVGLIIPLFTSEVESYIYISYLLWFLSGLLVNMQVKTKRVHAEAIAVGY